MTKRSRSPAVLVVLIGSGLIGSVSVATIGQQPRTYAISGLVVAVGADAVPPSTAVHLNDPAASLVRETVADAAGRFRFEDIPAGRFSISASSPGYVGLPHGASYFQGLEAPVKVEGTDVSDLKLHLVQTASINGTIRDRFGSPMASVRVSVQRWTLTNGVRMLAPASGAGSARTDRSGRYRVEDLPPGEYVVSVLPASLASQQAAREVYLETYYPSEFDPAKANLVAAGSGAEVGGIDINLALVRTSVVNGRFVAAPSGAMGRVIVWARTKGRDLDQLRSGVVRGDSFQFPSLVPGEYVLEARATLDSTASGSTWTHWGRTEITNTGSDFGDVQIVWAPTVSFSGVLALEGPASVEPPTSVMVHLLGASQLFLRDVPSGTMDLRGRLMIAGVAPGEYWLKAELPAAWRLKSIRDETGGDFTYKPIPIPAGGAGPTFSATFSAGVARLEGTLRNASGQATWNRAVVVFPQNPAAWEVPWANVHATRPDTRGRFVVPDLAEGNYFVAAFDDRSESAWARPAFLRELVKNASRVLLPQAGVIVHDVQVVR